MTDLYNQLAEESVIACIFMDNSLINKIQFLQTEHFFFAEFSELFEMMIEKLKTNQEISPIDFVEWSEEKFPEDPNFIWKIDIQTMGIVSCARKIKDLSDKRKMDEVIKATNISVDGKSADDLIEDLSSNLQNCDTTNHNFQIKAFSEVCEDNISDMNKAQKVYTTGFDRIDRSMNGGLHAGCSYCIAAKPKAGKTMLKGTIANHLRQREDKFLFIAAEMGSRAINKRILGAGLNRSPQAFKSDSGSDSFKSSVEFTASADKGSMFYVDAPRISLENLKMVIKKAIYNQGITGFILDYIQLVGGLPKGGNPVQHLEDVAQTIAEICKREDIWCLYSAQINREGTLRGGDGIIMAAEYVYELVVSEEEDCRFMRHVATRESEPMNLGSKDRPYLRIAKTGTHMEEL